MIYLYLFLVTLIPIAATIGLYFVETKTKFKNIPYKYRQIIIGVFYGIIAIAITEICFRIPETHGANVRNTAPLLAGLLFGGPAGIIAGVIGGVERFCATYWGAGALTQWACSISTIICGILAAILRKFMFENKRPTWTFALAIPIVLEVLDLTLVCLFNITCLEETMELVLYMALPMILFDALGVFVPTLVIQLLTKEVKKPTSFSVKKISYQVQWWLLGAIVMCYVLSTLTVYSIQTNQAYQDADTTFKYTISDVCDDVNETTSNAMLTILDEVVTEYNKDPFTKDPSKFDYYKNRFNQMLNGENYVVASIDLINYSDSSFACSSLLSFDYQFKMLDAEQSAEIHNKMKEVNPTTGKVEPFVQKFGKQGDTSGSYWKKYAASKINDEYYLVVSVSESQFYPFVNNKVLDITSYRRVKTNGYILIMQYDGTIVSDVSRYKGKELGMSIEDLQNSADEYKRQRRTLYEEDSFYMYTTEETYKIAIVLPYDEVLYNRDITFVLISFTEVLVFALLFLLVYFLLRGQVVKKIENINNDLSRIIDGDLQVKVNVNSSYEFASLSNDINYTVDTLKRYIDEASKRIDDELAFAKTIQESALPSSFPAFPDRNEFDIFATMNTAKEVGGDFYDFYIIDDTHVAFLIADVSGKGIPAAMFMMQGKVLIKNLAKNQLDPNEVLSKASDALAQNNDANMFITCWFGILNFKTGHVRFANAGHNAPLIFHKDGSWEYLEQKKNLVLAAMEGVPYKSQELDLKPGDRIYLYTDGVTEATRGDGTLYGEPRLLNYLNNNIGVTLEEQLYGVKKDIDVFIDGADQFDDITMLTIEFKGSQK